MSLFDFLKKKQEPELIAPPQPLPQRNDLCWCGSEQKYKKCHEQQDQRTLKLIRQKEQERQAKARRSVYR